MRTKKDIKVSVIIPVYNLEKYIERCIKSIANQTLEEIEIIVINDGSSDNTIEIIKKWESRDKRITTINQTNLGVSAARNRGLDHASGKYITFVDGDDYLEHTALEEMYRMAKTYKLDIVFCYLDSNMLKSQNVAPYNDTSINCIKKMIEGNMARTSCGILFNCKLIKNNSISFAQDMHYGEDFLFTLRSLLLSNKVVGIIPKPLYKVEHRFGSATRTYNINHFNRIVILNKRIQQLFVQTGGFDQVNSTLLNYCCQNIFSSITHIILSKKKLRVKLEYLSVIKNSDHTKKIANSIKDLKSKKDIFKVLLLKYTNKYVIWFCYVLYIKIKEHKIIF